MTGMLYSCKDDSDVTEITDPSDPNNPENPDDPSDGNDPLDPANPNPPSTIGGKQVIGYITQWDAWKTSEHGLPDQGVCNQLNLDFSKYTILNYSFFGVAKDGSIHSGDYRNKDIWMQGVEQDPNHLLRNVYDSWDYWLLYGDLDLVHEISEWNQDKLNGEYENYNGGWKHIPTGLTGEFPIPLHKTGSAKGLFELSKENNTKLMASIGGWSMCKHFPEMAADPAKRKRFIEDCKILIRMGFDGIDLDWEYPGPFAGMNFTGSQSDFVNFEKLVEELRAELGENRLITSCFSTVPQKLQGFNWGKLNGLMDFYNIMSYDMHGGWSTKAGHNSPLYPYDGEEEGTLSWETTRQALTNSGIQMSKVNMGMPFYGRAVVTQGNAALHTPLVKRSMTIQPDGAIESAADYDNFGQFDGTPFFSYIDKNTAGWTRHWDDQAKVPYKTNGNYFISYDDQESIRLKAEYIKDNNLAGAIVWQVYGDVNYGSVSSVYGGKLRQTSNNQSPLIDTVVDTFQ